ncbi:MAG: FAD binding domain-containing protein [Pseudomonadota bacterium]|nr:FAD binding domain-containing protein [Pseudomonadota bacterium]
MLKLPSLTILHPRNRGELTSGISDQQSEFKLLGGGTDLIIGMKKRLYSASALIGLKKIEELKGITYDRSKDSLTVGAMTTLSEFVASLAIAGIQPAIVDAVKMIAAPPIRNQATVGGNLCLDTRCYYFNQSQSWRKLAEPCFKCGGQVCLAAPGAKECRAVFSADLPPLLITLNAQVTIVSGNDEKNIPLADFYAGDGAKPNILHENEYVSQISIDNLSTKKSLYKKFRLRKALDFPLAGVALGFESNPEGKFNNPQIILNAVASAPLAVPEAVAILTGKSFDDEEAVQNAAAALSAAAKPIANVGSKPYYRKKMVALLLKKMAAELATGQEA